MISKGGWLGFLLFLILIVFSFSGKVNASDIKADIRVKDGFSHNVRILSDSINIETVEGRKEVLFKNLCQILKSPKGSYSFKFVLKDEAGQFWGNFIDEILRYKTTGGPQEYKTSDIEEIILCSPIKRKVEYNIEGEWKWSCCNAKYWGKLILKQTGNKITGIISDAANGTGGTIEGKIKGNNVQFERRWGGNVQAYELTVSGDGNTLEGTFTGNRDMSVGV